MVVLLVILFERTIGVLVSSAPFLLFGLLVAGFLRARFSSDQLRQAFTGGRSGSRLGQALRGAFWGTLLPTCAIGVVPVVAVLAAAGVPWGALVAFALAGAALNPYSASILLGQIEPFRAGILLVSLFVSITLIGLMVAVLMRSGRTSGDGWQRPQRFLPALAVSAGELLRREVPLALLATLAAVWVMSAAVDHGTVGHLFAMDEGGDPAAFRAEGIPWDHLLLVTPLSLGAYTSPDLAATQAGDIAHLRAIPSAALLWLLLGCGIGPGLIVWFGRRLSWRLAALTTGTAVAIALAATVVLHRPLCDALPLPEDSHAFDRHTRPYRFSFSDGQLARDLVIVTARNLSVPAGAGLLAIVALGACAWLPREFRRHALAPGAEPTSATPLKRWQTLAVGGALGLCALGPSVLVLFPSPGLTAEQMTDPDALVAIALRRGEWDSARSPMLRLESLAGRLRPASALRPLSRPPSNDELIREVESRLEELRIAIAARSPDAQDKAIATTIAIRDLRLAWIRRQD